MVFDLACVLHSRLSKTLDNDTDQEKNDMCIKTLDMVAKSLIYKGLPALLKHLTK